MTHIDEGIRVDALGSVKMWLEADLVDAPTQREKVAIFRPRLYLEVKPLTHYS